MKEILLFRGCTAPVRHPAYEAATIAVLKRLGMEVIPLEDANCCGAQFIESLSRDAFVTMSARILALAEEEGKDILTICGACAGSLKINKHYLDHNGSTRQMVNDILTEEGLRYTGKTRVRHLLQVLNEDIGYATIEKAIVRPYNGIRLAAHYGCHVTRPYNIVQVDDPESPSIIDRLIEIAGGVAVDYTGKTRCCGGPILAMDPVTAELIGIEKIRNVKAAGAQGIVTACVFCDIQLTQVQFGEGRESEKKIPVITLPQFLGHALGISDDRLGLSQNKISPYDVIMSTT